MYDVATHTRHQVSGVLIIKPLASTRGRCHQLLDLMELAKLRRGERLDLPRRPPNHHLLQVRLFPQAEMHATLILCTEAAAS